MGYWKSKVLPKIKKVFEKDSAKKAAATEASKSFDGTKSEISKEFEEKKTELQPKVVEIYEASSEDIKTLVRERKEAGLKKHATSVQKFLEELVKIEFPGSKAASEAASTYGPAYVSGPVLFVFEKVSSFIVVEEKAAEPAAETTRTEDETSSKEKEIVVETEKKEEVEVAPAQVEAEKTEPVIEAPPVAAESAKVEEAEPPKP